MKLLWNVVSRLHVLFVDLLLVSCLLDLPLAKNECIDKIFAHTEIAILIYFNHLCEFFFEIILPLIK